MHREININLNGHALHTSAAAQEKSVGKNRYFFVGKHREMGNHLLV